MAHVRAPAAAGAHSHAPANARVVGPGPGQGQRRSQRRAEVQLQQRDRLHRPAGGTAVALQRVRHGGVQLPVRVWLGVVRPVAGEQRRRRERGGARADDHGARPLDVVMVLALLLAVGAAAAEEARHQQRQQCRGPQQLLARRRSRRQPHSAPHRPSGSPSQQGRAAPGPAGPARARQITFTIRAREYATGRRRAGLAIGARHFWRMHVHVWLN